MADHREGDQSVDSPLSSSEPPEPMTATAPPPLPPPDDAREDASVATASAAASTTEEENSWAEMGGTPGTGFGGSTSVYESSPVPPPHVPDTPAARSSVTAAAPSSYNNSMYSVTTPMSPSSGGMPRFAQPDDSPDAGAASSSSYAARSAQAYSRYGGPAAQAPVQQQQQQQQQQWSSPQQGNNMSYSQQRAMVAPAPGGYGQNSGATPHAYSGAGYGQQQQQQQPPIAAPPPGLYANRASNMYGGNVGNNISSGHGQAFGNYSSPSQPGTSYGPPSSASAVPSGGSYAARTVAGPPVNINQRNLSSGSAAGSTSSSYATRSAQAYGQHQQHQQQQTGGPQQPPQNMASSSPYNAGSAGYAARSTQAHGQQAPPQQGPPYGGANAGAPSVGPGYSVVAGNASVASSYQTQQQASQYGGMPTTNMMPPPQSQQQQQQQIQERLLTEATRKVQEHAYYMKQAMEQKNLPVVLDRAAHMVGELGGPPHGSHHATAASGGPTNTGLAPKLTPKNYYELYMRALEDLPSLSDYLMQLASGTNSATSAAGQIMIVETAHHVQRRQQYTMRELYDCVQYCPRVVSRLYLQITVGAALISTGEMGAKWVLKDLIEAVRCEQNPIRGLFLRNHLLNALRDKFPDTELPSSESIEVNAQSDGQLAVVDEQDKGNVKNSYEFILENFMEMNKLWVRIQHLPGDGKSKEVKKRRERERNELRILVGTNLVRLSQLDHVTSKIYGEVILPKILEHIVVCGDPLSQAYLMDCLVQVFPDEYHIETLQILLNVCPRLKDKVNIRTILQGLMDRLANYLADEELLDESDTNEVKQTLARDSFGLFEECVQNVFNARGPKLTSKEVIRLQTALLQFSIKCYNGNREQIGHALGVCVRALRQANASYDIPDGTVAVVPHDKLVVKTLDDVSVAELEKMLSIPLDSMALQVLQLEHYESLITFLPWENRRGIAVTLLAAVDKADAAPTSVGEVEKLFSVINPLISDENGSNGPLSNTMAGLRVDRSSNGHQNGSAQRDSEDAQVSKLVSMIYHNDPRTLLDMLSSARNHVSKGSGPRMWKALSSVVFAALKLSRRVAKSADGVQTSTPAPTVTENAPGAKSVETLGDSATELPPEEASAEEFLESDMTVSKLDNAQELEQSAVASRMPLSEEGVPSTRNSENENTLSVREILAFVQQTIALIGSSVPELAIKLYLEAALTVESLCLGGDESGRLAQEFCALAFTVYEEMDSDAVVQRRCLVSIIGALPSIGSITTEQYEKFTTKTAQFAAKLTYKPDQCQLVALCSYLFFPVPIESGTKYRNGQRALECLQRALKLADACTSLSASHVHLFVDLLEHYMFFFEHGNESISHGYITGLVALIKEHLANCPDGPGVSDAKRHFGEVIRSLRRKKAAKESAEKYEPISIA